MVVQVVASLVLLHYYSNFWIHFLKRQAMFSLTISHFTALRDPLSVSVYSLYLKKLFSYLTDQHFEQIWIPSMYQQLQNVKMC